MAHLFTYNRQRKYAGRELWWSVYWETPTNDMSKHSEVSAFVVKVSDRRNSTVFEHRQPCVNCHMVMAHPNTAYPLGMKYDPAAYEVAVKMAKKWMSKQPRKSEVLAGQLNSLDRCAFLLHKILNGDHKALDNAPAAVEEAVTILKSADRGDEWMEEYGKCPACGEPLQDDVCQNPDCG